MKRDTKKLALALLMAPVFFVSAAELIGQSPQSSGSDKTQQSAAASSAAAAAKPTPATPPSTGSALPAQASSHAGKAADASGERHGRGVDQYRYRRLPQAGNALVRKDEARQIHVGGGCHKGRVQTGEVRA
jgi:hypothetical protein